MEKTVRIRTKERPEGKLYELALDLDADRLVALTKLVESAAAARGPRRIQALRVSQLLGRAVSVVLPGLEPYALRRLSDEKRHAILDLWMEAMA